MAWTPPRTWSTGEYVTAVLLNEQLRSNLLALQPVIGEYAYFARQPTNAETVIGLNWLECNGTAVSRTTYADLYATLNAMRSTRGSGTTTLNGAITNSQTTIAITAPYPAGWPFWGRSWWQEEGFEILVDAEKMLVTSLGNSPYTTLTVVRGREGTTAVAHLTAATVSLVADMPFGSGDGSTTFRVPDLRGRMPVGVGVSGINHADVLTIGRSEGVAVGSRTPSHFHYYLPPQQVGGYSGSGYGWHRSGYEKSSGNQDLANAPAHLMAGVWGIRFVG